MLSLPKHPVCQVLFALASLLRHFPHAQSRFLSHGGLQVLSELFRAHEGGVLRTRIVTMLYDMISEKVQTPDNIVEITITFLSPVVSMPLQ